jgi:Uma2 family endonuclease
MNEAFALPHPRPTTRAAEGLPRWRWTVAEIELIAMAGYFHEDERFELLGGEIVPMSPKGRRHEIIRGEIAFRFTRAAPDAVFVVSEPQFNLRDDTYVMPDILIHPISLKTPDVRGIDALLVIEVADSSLHYDLATKAPLYAEHGVREYWVIDTRTLSTKVHREPAGTIYGNVREVVMAERLVAALVPECAISLGTLRVD